jgi:hypothetical protein
VKSISGLSDTAAYAIVPSALTCVSAPSSSYGLDTVTPSSAAASANSASIAARTAGSSIPASDSNTIEPVCPDPNPPK